MKKQTKVIIAIALLMAMFPLMLVPASANSRAQEWYGRDANGVVFVGDNVPIEVTSELLTFDIPTLPYASYRDAETFLAYNSRVTAEYTFHNPTDMTITATLLFPFGTTPEYYKIYDSISGERLIVEDLSQYGVMVNNENVESTLRHSAIIGDFSSEEDSSRLLDEFIEDDFYHPNLTVTKYSYEIGGSQAASESFSIRLTGLNDNQRPVNYSGNIGSHIDTDTGDFILTKSAIREGETETVYFYVFGEPLTELPDASWKKANGSNPSTDVERYIKYLGHETTTLKEFIQKECPHDNISEIDWYNACIAEMKDCEVNAKGKTAIRHMYLGYLMRWYEYEITLEPGENITNTVIAPMYPEIVAWDRPIEYDYTYLLSPASNWAEFGTLDIVINTPYEMIDCNVQGFEKTDSGYRLVRSGLPTDEEGAIDLFFTLENDGKTPLNQPARNIGESILERVLGFFKLIFMGIVLIIEYIVYSIERTF